MKFIAISSVIVASFMFVACNNDDSTHDATAQDSTVGADSMRHNGLIANLGITYDTGARLSSASQTFAVHPTTDSVSQVAFVGGNKVVVDSKRTGITPLAGRQAVLGTNAEMDWIAYDVSDHDSRADLSVYPWPTHARLDAADFCWRGLYYD
jgi:hypothetical protein